MELDPKAMSHAWWKGAFGGTLKGLAIGLLVGAGSALLLHFVLIPLLPAIGLPSIAQAFAGFLTLSPGTAAYGSSAYAFSALPLAIFSGLSGMLGGLVNGGSTAVNAYKQDTEHRMNQARLDGVEAREMALEQAANPSRQVQAILANGPRQINSFTAAEAARDTAATNSPTIH